MKRFLASMIVAAFFVTGSSAYAYNNSRISEPGLSEIPVLSRETEFPFIKHIISFPTIAEISESLVLEENSVSSAINKIGLKNIENTISFVKSLNLDVVNEREYIKKILSSIGDGYLDSCTIYTPTSNFATTSTSSYTYYGTYQGRQFYTQPSMDLSINYRQDTERSKVVLNAWITAAKDLILTYVPGANKISVAFTLLNFASDLTGNGYSSQTGDYAEYYARCIRHFRRIYTYDTENYIEADYCPLIEDAKANIYPYVVYHCNPELTGHSAIVYENPSNNFTLYSEYYRDKSWNLQKAYYKYENSPSSLPYYYSNIDVTNSKFTWTWSTP